MTIIYIYNLLLTILYAVTGSLSFNNFWVEPRGCRRKVLLMITLLSVLFILNNWLISMTELIASFGAYYNQSFSGLPLAKTVLFLATNYCLISLVSLMRSSKVSGLSLFLLFLSGIWMLIMPLFPKGQMQVYLYYLPNQIFLAYCGMTALLKTRTSLFSDLSGKYLKWLGILSIFFALTILLEDSVVIFNFDDYRRFNMRIQNRNFNEDLFAISICLLAIYYLLKDHVRRTETNARWYLPEEETIIARFCQDYHLTSREKEVFILLLDKRHNQEIADSLMLSLGTVKTHVHNIYIKLGIGKRQELFASYQRYRLESRLPDKDGGE